MKGCVWGLGGVCVGRGKGRKPEYPEKRTDDQPQKMPHTKIRKSKPKARLEPELLHWWQAPHWLFVFSRNKHKIIHLNKNTCDGGELAHVLHCI